VFVFRSRRADRLKLLYWDGTGLVMAYKRLEDTTFTWPAIKDGMMALSPMPLYCEALRRRRADPLPSGVPSHIKWS
ncbi:MAG: IS66 family insertion sequence element accessory protein TnpB, partial [Loktanella sp.]|nr:IS66 family insertion sequence element accessory protein TnpB [Loktanella sp.]